MRQGIGVALLLILFLVGAGLLVVTAVSLRSSATASAAPLDIQPAVSGGEAVSAPVERAQPLDASAKLSADDNEMENISFSRADHQGVCDGDKSASSAGY